MKRRSLLTLGILVSALLCGTAAKAPHNNKLDTAWKRYDNKEVGYCVNYPSRWQRGEAFDGAGMYFATGMKKFSRPLGEIDVAAVVQRPAAEPVLPAAEYLQIHLENLKKFERAAQLEVLEQKQINLFGQAALFTKDRYFDPLDNRTWVDEIILARNEDRLYRLELECRADQVERFEAVFSHFVETFKFDCNFKQ
jgi:hypothetical protein